MTARPLQPRPLRRRDVDVAGWGVVVYEAADPGAALDRAIEAERPAPYGTVLWDSAIKVACRLRAEANTLAGRSVFEIGAGCGLCGIVAAQAGAHVVCSDVDDLVFAAIEAGAQGAGVAVDCAVFDVCGAEPVPVAEVVVIADLLYEPRLAAAVARRVLEVVQRGSAVIVGDPERAGRASFLRLVNAGGLAAGFVDDVMVVAWP